MSAPKLTQVQRDALRLWFDSDGRWSRWANITESTYSDLRALGLVDDRGITDAGRVALRGGS